MLWLCLLLWVLPGAAAADEPEELLTEQLQASGAAELYAGLPEDTRELLAGLGVTELSPDAVYRLDLGQALHTLLRTAGMMAGEIGEVLVSVWGILLLAALTETLRPDSTPQLGRVFQAASVLCCGMLLLQPVGELLHRTSTMMAAASTFQLTFVPVFAGIMAVGGQAVTAGKYTVLTLTAAQLGSSLLSSVIAPLLRMCMAMNVTAAAAPSIRLDGFFGSLRKGMTSLLGLVMTLFLTILSLQGAVGGAADSLAAKTAQFLLSSTIPVVGGALSQAYGSVRGYVGLMKTTVGAFGMIAAWVLLLPQLLSLTLWRLLLDLTASAGEMLGQREISSLLRNTSALLGILLGVLLCSGLMTVVSVGVMLLLRGNA